MRFLLIGLLGTLALSAQAEVIQCTFTEPFINIDVDHSKNQITYSDPVIQEKKTYPILETSNKEGRIRVTWGGQDDNSVLEYWTDPHGGSDGMSDFLFPMSGETWTGDTRRLVGGCYTEYDKPIDPSQSPLPGCYEVLRGEFEDGSSYYQAFGEKISGPLKANPKTASLGNFLDSAFVTHGYLELNFRVCRSIDEALK